MLKPATSAAARAPRGTKPVSQAFFAALEGIPESARAAVAKAALTMIRDEMKLRRDKLKATAAKEKEKEKARAAAPAASPKADPPKRATKAAPKPSKPAAVAKDPAPAEQPAAPKRRPRKAAAETPTT